MNRQWASVNMPAGYKDFHRVTDFKTEQQTANAN